MTIGYSVDRLDFDRLVAEAQRRIAARSHGLWTLHAPVDPGMTLLELYAWQLEQRGYVADRLSPPLRLAILRLLGERPRPAQIAATVLELEPEAGSPVLVPAGTRARVVGRPDLEFTTRDALAASRLAAPIGLETADGDRSLDLERRPVALLRAEGWTSTARIVVTFTDPPPAGAAVGLRVELAAPDRIEPGWSPEAVDIAPPTVLEWWCAWDGAGGAAGRVVVDGTGGLRRSGVVCVPVPAGAGARLTLTVRAARATFTAPPLVRAIRANAVIADHRSSRKHVVAEPWLALPGQRIALPADHGLPLPGVVVEMPEHDGTTYEWSEVASLAPHGPSDRVFVVDRDRATAAFGDGLTGRLPRRAAGTSITATFDAGGGRAGCVGPSVWELEAPPAGAPPAIAARDRAGVRTAVHAIGGRDAEPLDAAAVRVAAMMRARTRAVLEDDYRRIAIDTPGIAVARAHAAIGHDEAARCVVTPGVVTVYVVPEVVSRSEVDVAAGRALAELIADPGLIAAVAARFAEARLVGTRVDVRPARYIGVRVGVTVLSDPWNADELRRRVAAAVRVFLDPLLGGPSPERGGWAFGQAIRPTEILREVHAALGRDGEVTAITLARAGENTAAACAELALPPHSLVGTVTVDVRITPPVGRGEGLR